MWAATLMADTNTNKDIDTYYDSRITLLTQM